MAKQRLMAAGTTTLILLALAGCLAATGVAADVYKVVDEDGRITYTDQLPKGKKGEKVELPKGNSLPRTVLRDPRPAEPSSPIPTHYNLQISYPPDEFHVNPGMRNLNIQVTVAPPLYREHELQITDNGEVIEGTTMENIVVRGTHAIQAKVVDAQGRTVSQSEPIHIYVHRPTVNN